MGRLGMAFYVLCLAVFAVLMIIAVYTQLWVFAVIVAVLATVFVFAGWFVLARAWQVRRAPRRRPVRRR